MEVCPFQLEFSCIKDTSRQKSGLKNEELLMKLMPSVSKSRRYWEGLNSYDFIKLESIDVHILKT